MLFDLFRLLHVVYVYVTSCHTYYSHLFEKCIHREHWDGGAVGHVSFALYLSQLHEKPNKGTCSKIVHEIKAPFFSINY